MTAKGRQISFHGGQPKWPSPVQPNIARPPIQAQRVGPPPTALASRPPGAPMPAFTVRPLSSPPVAVAGRPPVPAIQRMQGLGPAGPAPAPTAQTYNFNSTALPRQVPREGIKITDANGETNFIGEGYFKGTGSGNYVVYARHDGDHFSISKKTHLNSHHTSAATAQRRGEKEAQAAAGTRNWNSFQSSQISKKKRAVEKRRKKDS
jgi:hypothetical protein